MPTILLRSEPGDRPPHALLVESAELAQRVASMLDVHPAGAPELIGDHRALSAYRGWWRGRPVTIQTTGVGAPATAMVVEELLMSGAQRFVRVATAVAVAADLARGDVLVPVAASPADGTTRTYVRGSPIAAAAGFTLVVALVDALTRGLASSAGRVRHGSVATVDVLPDAMTIARWRPRGIVAVDMASAPLFYLCARAGAGSAPGVHADATAASVLVIAAGAATEDVVGAGAATEDVAAGAATQDVAADDVIADDILVAALDALTARAIRR